MMLHRKFGMIGFFGILLAVLLSACGLVGNSEFTVSLKEANLNEVIQSAPVDSNNPFRVTNVDMQDGIIRVAISFRKADGSDLTGSYDLLLSAADGQIVTEIINVDMPGLKLDQPILDQFAELINRDFLSAASGLGGQVTIHSLQITDDAIEMALTLDR